MPPLLKFTEVIYGRCWEGIRKEIGAEAESICKWEGWHPILRAQLEMFFELKKEVDGKYLLTHEEGESGETATCKK